MNHKTKHLSVAGCALSLLLMSWAVAQNQVAKEEATNSEALEVSLRQPFHAGAYTRNNVPIRVLFENNRHEKARLLRLFKPVKSFWSITLTDISDKPVPVTKPKETAQVAVPSSALRYIELGERESFSIVVNIAELLPPNLPEGSYGIALTYRNTQGENCFKGTKTTESVSIDIVDEPVANVPGSISEQKAVDLARKALIGSDIALKPDGKVSVRNTVKQFIVTFGEPSPPGVRGPDYDAQVFINRITGKVEKVWSGS